MQENCCRQKEIDAKIGEFQLIDGDTRREGGYEAGQTKRYVDIQKEQGNSRQITDPSQNALQEVPRNASFRKSKGEMDQQRRCGQKRGKLGPIYFPIEGIQLTGVMESKKNKRCQAKSIKMHSIPSANENECADEEIECAYNSEIVFDRQRLGSGSRNHARAEAAVLAPDLIVGLGPNA